METQTPGPLLRVPQQKERTIDVAPQVGQTASQDETATASIQVGGSPSVWDMAQNSQSQTVTLSLECDDDECSSQMSSSSLPSFLPRVKEKWEEVVCRGGDSKPKESIRRYLTKGTTSSKVIERQLQNTILHNQGTEQDFLPFLLVASSMNQHSIIQCSCHGLTTNLEDIHNIAERYPSICFCLQETNRNEQTPCHLGLKRLNVFRKDHVDTARASGGVAILTADALPLREVPVTTDLEAIAVQIPLNGLVILCSLYLPPSVIVEQKQLEDLINRLPPPFLLLGDFSAQNLLWGSTKVDSHERTVEKILLSTQVCLLNSGKSTYVHSATQSFSAIDLSLCSPSLFQSIG